MNQATNEDNWHGVQDSRKRKQIQDRLAQRARRQRLREAKKSQRSCIQDETVQHDGAMQLADLNQVEPTVLASSSSPKSPGTDHASTLVDDLILEAPLELTTDHNFLPMPSMTVYTALYINGAMMGLSCSTTMPARSKTVSADIPSSLHPTPLQLLTIHPLWVDRFPFPRMRNNIINLSQIVDDEEFLGDMFTSPSFILRPGFQSWDPKGWQIDRSFAKKWGYLFY